MSYTPPAHQATAFNCPLCGAYASQTWSISHHYNVKMLPSFPTPIPSYEPNQELETSLCTHCRMISIWYKGVMLYPDNPGVPPPQPDLPDNIRRDYLEAASILSRSPRGAAALLRLAIQKLCADLCKELGERSSGLHNDIGVLVRKGLDPQIQQALDAVRVIGNNAVHPGQIDLADNHPLAAKLFDLVNIISDIMITRPRSIRSVFEGLPEGTLKEIERRDAQAKKETSD